MALPVLILLVQAIIVSQQVLWNPCFGIMFFSYVATFELKGVGYVKEKVQNELLTQVRGRA